MELEKKFCNYVYVAGSKKGQQCKDFVEVVLINVASIMRLLKF